MNTPNQNQTLGCSVPLLPIFIVFLVLKLTGTIAWSWWMVTLPLWIGPALYLGFVITALIVVAAAAFMKV